VFTGFEIVASEPAAEARVFVPPDYFMCADCHRELLDPADRRYRYPFINCTQCGPRFTLIESLPYDRPNTSMADFPLCPDCEAEYSDPLDRRFHAEPVACPGCGPQLEFVAADGSARLPRAQALDAAVEALRGGGIVAVKGVGGYHLMCDARSEDAVGRLRARKHRPAKPLAVMFPLEGADGLDAVRRCAAPDPLEAALIAHPSRPIVLVGRREDTDLAPGIAPGLAELGVFLPYSPLHALLLGDFGAPLVATSGNISGEPVLTDAGDVAARLATVADAFLHHDRRIVRPADDSVSRRIAGIVRPLRIGRGSAPRDLRLPVHLARPVLAVGGHMKGTVVLAFEDRAVMSPHIGEMDSPRSLAVFEKAAADLQALYGVTAAHIVCDSHPGYTTHRWARAQGLPVTNVWHHYAHAGALAGELDLPGRWLVFAWDGVGLGPDGTLWGGEALLGRPGDWRRVASLRSFRLPGGDRAGREPWRSAAALHWENGREWADCPDPDGIARRAWEQDVNCPRTSAAGRLFDAAAALILGETHVSFEAQGPMYLEALCEQRRDPVVLPLERDAAGVWRSDWAPLLPLLTAADSSPARRAEQFHSSLAEAIVSQAVRIAGEDDFDRIGLTGGVFQNRFLTELTVELLDKRGFIVALAAALPCNDAALSFGQAVEFGARDQAA
jgi:hydrogenase maturation protein HypF